MAQGQGQEDKAESPRLTPEMRSRKLQAHDFIKRYFARWGHSPTLGELSSHLGVSRKRAYDLVHQLSEEQQIEVVAGRTRGIRLIDRSEELCEADVLARLVTFGWTVGRENEMIAPPLKLSFPTPPLTEKGLPPLDYIEDEAVETGDGSRGEGNDGKISETGAGARLAASARGTKSGAPRRVGASPS